MRGKPEQNDLHEDPDYTPDVVEPIERLEPVEDVRVTHVYDGIELDRRAADVLEGLARRRSLSPEAMASEILRHVLEAIENPDAGRADAA